MKLSKEQITKACDFWAKKLEHPDYQMYGPDDPQQKQDIAPFMASVLWKPIEPYKIMAFKQLLSLELEDHPVDFIDVDYDPDILLRNVAMLSGIEVTRYTFPWKTSLRFKDGKVFVKEGYGRDWNGL